MVRVVVLTCTAVNTCAKLEFGNIEGVCNFNVVFSPFMEFCPLGP